MTRRWFGTDGIRGSAGEGPLAESFLVRVGLALGEEVGAGKLALLARDTRESGPTLTRALANGLLGAGLRVVDLGVVPTPALPMEMRTRSASLGAMISASHNPWRDNGVKVFGAGGLKLSDEREVALEERIERVGTRHTVAANGEPEAADGAEAYIEAMLARFEGLDLSGMLIAVDCANGSAFETGPRVLEELGAVVTALHNQPDGRNINEECGSTHIDSLRQVVANNDYEVGIAFDGDADRVLLVDAGGRVCTGDHMLGFVGGWWKELGRLPGDTVVATVMSNLGLAHALKQRGVSLLRTPVGDRHVLAAMRDGGFTLGGEDSGHVIFCEDDVYLGDGLHTALRVLEGLRARGTTVADVIDAVQTVPQRLVNVEVPSKPDIARLRALKACVDGAHARHGENVRIVLRYSGTENLARVMVEGIDQDTVDELADELAVVWRREIEMIGAGG